MKPLRLPLALVLLTCPAFLWSTLGYSQEPRVSRASDKLDIPAISRSARGAVVSIIVSDKDDRPISQGSGFFIRRDGELVTNYHVIRSGTSAIAKLPDGTSFEVEGMLASDEGRDIAILKVRGNNFHNLKLGDSAQLEIGESVVAIGSPLSLESTVSNGILSAIRTEKDGAEFLQITAPISPGSSGGPVFDMEGRVIGITTAYLKEGENLNFAIPINQIKPMLRTRGSKPTALPDDAESPPSEKNTGPSLTETFRWLNQIAGEDGITDNSELGGFSRTHFVTQGSSCEIAIHEFYGRGYPGSESLFFNLSDVDPNSIREYADHVIGFDTTGNEMKITWCLRTVRSDLSSCHTSGDTVRSAAVDKGNIGVGDSSLRSRIAQAFKHAVELCGGKPSTF